MLQLHRLGVQGTQSIGLNAHRVSRPLFYHPAQDQVNLRFKGTPTTPTTPKIVRIVVKGDPGKQNPERLLLEALGKWPAGVRGKYTITPGGFIQVPWPTPWTQPSGWSSPETALADMVKIAQPVVEQFLRPGVKEELRGKTHYLTLGVDLNDPGTGFKKPHGELVAIYDVEHDKIVQWTGKSYPHNNQPDTLIHITDLKSHLWTDEDQEKVLVLGCHDLNMFSPRGYKAQSAGSERRHRTDDFRQLVQDFHPTVVLQHPHGTDSPNIWRGAWLTLTKLVPSIQIWASAIGYFNFLGDNAPRQPLATVLRLTQSENQPPAEKTLNIEVGA